MSECVLTSVIIDVESDNTDGSVVPEVPQKHIIMCFGEYVEEEKELEIYWYSITKLLACLTRNTRLSKQFSQTAKLCPK